MVNPVVSVIVPCYNYGAYVAQAIDSLLHQTLADIQIIVINDCSTDSSAGVLAEYVGHPKVQIINHTRNQGHINSYNEGLALAIGKYVGLMSADDFCLHREALMRQVAMFEGSSEVGLVYTAHVLIDTAGHMTNVVPWPTDYVRSGWEEFRHLMWSNYIPASGTLLRRDVQNEVGPYDARLPHSGDWDIWLRASARHTVAYLAEPMYAYRIHGSNMSHTRITPQVAANQLVLTIDKAFGSLEANAPPDIVRTRSAAVRHALLQTAWIDLYHGRRSRAWQGLIYALSRDPSMIFHREFQGLVRRAIGRLVN